MIAINNNLMAMDTANSLKAHYGRLQTSTERLSSGLRINSAADDAAGLAIRELMRADIAALDQGVRNANDAISMLQTFDGALGIIDEKLIRMKELAEQAATGTYDSTQRLMIDSEFQAMASEINRIARATDFNGIKLLDGNFGVGRTQTVAFATATAVTAGDEESSNNASNVQINRANLTTAKYNGYLPTEPAGPVSAPPVNVSLTVNSIQTAATDTETNLANGPHFHYDINIVDGGNFQAVNVADVLVKYDNGTWTCQVKATDTSQYIDVAFNGYGTSGNGPYARFADNDYMVSVTAVSYAQQTLTQADLGNLFKYDKTTGLELRKGDPTYKRTYELDDPIIKMNSTNGTATYTSTGATSGTITARLRNGDSVVLGYTGSLQENEEISFSLDIAGRADEKIVPIPDEDSRVKIHFGTMNDSAEDYYYIFKRDATIKGLGLEGVDIQTQDNAQGALVKINDAIVKKDEIRADYGALQNRFENTISNLRIQAENLQVSESRISDADIALEMTQFVRNQILTQSAVAMLAQANSIPQLVMKLIG